jgi:3-methyladenine DNA glycosylase AlkD
LAEPALDELRRALEAQADPVDAANLARFFKTGPGGYGEGDRFRGLRVPALRKLARQYRELDKPSVLALLHSPFHEDRLLALLILVEQFRRADAFGQAEIYRLYLDNTLYINNWDLVDSSAEHIVGAYLFPHQVLPLEQLAASGSLWERRIAMLATFHFIKRHHFDAPLQIAAQLLHDPHDLIHKAVGWMLREIGERDPSLEEAFLQQHYQTMPRTMLRYAIEKLPEERRQAYLRGEV